MDTTENDEDISFSTIVEIIKRRLALTIFLCVLFAGTGYVVTDYLPHFYKARTVLSILSSYFQHPLVSDLISEVQDPSEMGSQRLSLLRLALNDSFLDNLGVQYNLYEHPDDSSLRTLDREMLLKKIEYFSVSPSSFQISMTTDSPETAFEVTRDILAQMTYTLTDRRFQILLKARDSIIKQAKLLKTTLNGGNSVQQETLDNQLATMENNLASLRERFTDSHPDVVRLKGQVRALASRRRAAPAPVETDDYSNVFLSPASRASSQEIFDDLLKKLSHLNIVLEMEKDRETVSYLAVIEKPAIPIKPIFPNRMQLVLGGGALGFLLGALIAAAFELSRASKASPERSMELYGLELLGELPIPSRDGSVLLIEGPPRNFPALPGLLSE